MAKELKIGDIIKKLKKFPLNEKVFVMDEDGFLTPFTSIYKFEGKIVMELSDSSYELEAFDDDEED
jgi:hypothetical protein